MGKVAKEQVHPERKKPKAYFNWSSGKDAALALYHLQQADEYTIERLVTSINGHHNRVSMHGLRTDLLVKQAHSIGIPLTTIPLPEQPTMERYNQEIASVVTQLKAEGFSHCGFGDIFLEDLRIYREKQLAAFDISCSFPLWKRDTQEIIKSFIDLDFKAVVVCVKSDLLDASFIGRDIDEDFINDLPSDVDPCGENGEFHTFCYDGPIFSAPIPFVSGEKVYRSYENPSTDQQTNEKTIGFWFGDFLLAE